MKARFAKDQKELAKRIAYFLKTSTKDAGLTYEALAERMTRLGYPETEESVKSKIQRGTFRATFLVAAVAALGLTSIAIKDI